MLTEFAETQARALYARAGYSLTDAPGPIALAERVLGPGSVLTHSGLTTPGHYLPKQRQIWLRRGLSVRRAMFVVAHELAEMLMSELRYSAPDREAVCDAVAAAIVCPRDAFRWAIDSQGRDLAALAQTFVTTQSVVALRIAELRGTPTALVTPYVVHIRGEPWAWPAPSGIRKLALVPALPPELIRHVVTDAPRRFVLMAA